MITREQCRAGRALLRWTQEDLAGRARVSALTVRNFERGHGAVKRSTAQLLRLVFEEAGIEFLDPDSKGPGARLTKPVR